MCVEGFENPKRRKVFMTKVFGKGRGGREEKEGEKTKKIKETGADPQPSYPGL